MIDLQQLSRKHWLCIALVLLLFLSSLLSPYAPSPSILKDCSPDTTSPNEPPTTHIFKNMNELSTTNASQFSDLILVTVLVRTSQINEVSKLLSLLGALSYPLHRLDVAFLLTDATSGSHPVFEHMLSHNQHSFRSIVAYGKNMIMDLPKEKAQIFDFQPLMRAQLARARNYLTRSALKDEHQWILAMDVSLDDIPHDIIQQLMSVDVDVVVPNCMVKRDDGKIWGFEKSNWQDTELSLTITDNPQEDYIFMEGMYEEGRKYFSQNTQRFFQPM